jgi:hypothetical protein
MSQNWIQRFPEYDSVLIITKLIQYTSLWIYMFCSLKGRMNTGGISYPEITLLVILISVRCDSSLIEESEF